MRQEMISALRGCIFGFRHTTSNFPCKLVLLHPLQNGDFVIVIPAVARCSRNARIDALPHTFCTRTLFLSVTHQVVRCGGDLALQMSYWFAFPRRATGAGTSLCLFVSSQPRCCFQHSAMHLSLWQEVSIVWCECSVKHMGAATRLLGYWCIMEILVMPWMYLTFSFVCFQSRSKSGAFMS